MTFVRIVILLLAGVVARCSAAQQSSISLGELARQERARKQAVANPARVIETLDSDIACGGNWDCFIQAVVDRLPARMSVPDRVDLGETYGWVITSNVRLEIRNCTAEACVLVGRTEDSTLKFTDLTRKRYMDGGSTAEQVDEYERAAQARVKRQDESSVTCTFQLPMLKEFLERRREGSTADEDWRLADRCDGLDQTITNPSAPATRQSP